MSFLSAINSFNTEPTYTPWNMPTAPYPVSDYTVPMFYSPELMDYFNYLNSYLFDFNVPVQSSNLWDNNFTPKFKNDKNAEIEVPYRADVPINQRLIDAGYDEKKGRLLAQKAIQGYVGFKGQCATFSKTAIQNAGLGKYEKGHAYQCTAILDKNPNFKRIDTTGLNLDRDLPAGCVLVYPRGVAKYSKQYGHIEITDGKGHAYSDGKTNNIRQGAIVYIPVKTKHSKSYTA